MLDQLGGRKFFGFIIGVIAFVVLAVFKLITPEQFQVWFTAIFGVYTAGNAIDKIAK